MSKKTARENLKSFSWIYIVLIVLYIGATILCFAVPDIANQLKANFGNEIVITFCSGTAVSVVFCLLYFWLCRRVAEGKSQGTVYMILLILGIIGGIATAVAQKGFTVLSLEVIVDLIGLYYVIQARKE